LVPCSVFQFFCRLCIPIPFLSLPAVCALLPKKCLFLVCFPFSRFSYLLIFERGTLPPFLHRCCIVSTKTKGLPLECLVIFKTFPFESNRLIFFSSPQECIFWGIFVIPLEALTLFESLSWIPSLWPFSFPKYQLQNPSPPVWFSGCFKSSLFRALKGVQTPPKSFGHIAARFFLLVLQLRTG